MTMVSRREGSATDEDIEASTLDVAKLEQLRDAVRQAEWRPGKQEYAVMVTLAVISLMVALDATILVSVLPVGLPSENIRLVYLGLTLM